VNILDNSKIPHQRWIQAIARKLKRATTTYDSAAIIQQEIESRLLERLDFIKLEPKRILNLGSKTGTGSNALLKKYPQAQIINLEITEEMLNFSKTNFPSAQYSYLCADTMHLPLKNQSIDFVFSNCAVHGFLESQYLFKEIQRILKPEGLFLFSSLGPDTLQELRASFAMIDQYEHVYPFMDMHDIGDRLLHTPFGDPVMDREILKLHYHSVEELLQDLKLTGSQYIQSSQNRGLGPKNTVEKLKSAYEQYRNADNLLAATFEVIYGHAWAIPESLLHAADAEGIVCIPIAHVQRL
jgi:malonyl-CoA O-methyltransferase